MTAAAAMSNTLAWARFYKSRGWQPIPVPLGTKRPVREDWPQLIIAESDLPTYFTAEANIGILLGKPSGGLIDIDLDCGEAIALAPFFLPETTARFGRPTKMLSHWLYTCSEPIPETKKWIDDDGCMMIELRSSGAQTIFPGSIHNSGEAITFDRADVGDPAAVSGEELVEAINLMAATILIARRWPGEGGRHHAAMALAGWLLRNGRTLDQAMAIVTTAARLAGDSEIEDRRRAVESTHTALAAGRNVTGLPTIASLLGEKVVGCIQKWLPTRQSGFKIFGGAGVPQEPQEASRGTVDALAPRPVGLLDFRKIERRRFVLGRRLISKFVTVTIAPGGLGKSTLTLEEAIAIATGREITGERVHVSGPVWVYNNEDPQDELERRIAAICIHWGIPIEDIADRVFINSGLERRLVVAQEVNGVVVQTPDVDALIHHIRANGIVCLVVDPFVRAHRVNENSNDAIDMVAEQFTKIASETGCAINLAHHPRKAANGTTDSHAGSADSARGASSLISAARAAHTLTNMSAQDAEKLGIPEEARHYYVRLDDAKGNLTPPAQRAVWFKRTGVLLPNSDSALGLDGDEVGVLVREDLTPQEQAARTKEEQEEEQLRVDICRLIQPGKEVSTNHLVTQLLAEDYFHVGRDKLRRRIINAVGTAIKPSIVETFDGVFRLWQFKSGTSKTAPIMIRKMRHE